MSVGPLTEFYCAWKRAIKIGNDANVTAAITCITIAPKFRSQKLQSEILLSLRTYGKTQG